MLTNFTKTGVYMMINFQTKGYHDHAKPESKNPSELRKVCFDNFISLYNDVNKVSYDH